MDIFDFIGGIVVLLLLLSVYVFFIVISIMQSKKQRDYKKTLNEHDKSVIADYESYTRIL